MFKFGKNNLLLVCSLILLCLLISGCTPVFWIQKYRDMPDVEDEPDWDYRERRTIKAKNFDLEKYYQNQYGKRSAPKFEAKLIKIDETQLVVRDEVDGVVIPAAGTSDSGVRLTFIHLSDVQLRDEQVRLYDKATSKLADYIITSFEHSPPQEAFDGAAYYAIVQTVNATVEAYGKNDPLRPKFMIHTGDAMDAGVVHELYEFLYISNETKIPWYNAIGNHDVGTFGNIKPKMIYVNDPFVEFMTIHSKFNFVNIHHSTFTHYPFVNVSPTNTNREPTARGGPLYSLYNGFDRLNYIRQEISSEEFVCRECPGYYSIEVKAKDENTKDPAVQMIVLDTGFSFGAHGTIDEEQLKWLRNEISKSGDKIILVFGHHNITSITDGNKLTDLLAENPSVIAYFCGHTHSHEINYHPGKHGNFGFWEIITDAIFTYPQEGSLVRIKYENGLGLLDVYAFKHSIQEKYTDSQGNQQDSPLFTHAQIAYMGASGDIPARRKRAIENNKKDRCARLRFPYPKLK